MKKKDSLRRYPALAFLAVAAILAVALPSALNIPNAGPPTLAEFAPVPGDGQQAGGDLGRLGSGSTGDVGSSAGDGDVGSLPTIDPVQPDSSLKRCVGNPPRQTEDELSPPCVASFEGDNFGATTRGVTADEIRVVVHTGPATEERFHDLDDPSDVDSNAQEESLNQVIRGIARYFNSRYQKYKRHVHVWTYKGAGSEPAQIKAQVKAIRDHVDPFALLAIGVNNAQQVAKEAARQGIVSLSYGAFDRADQRRVAPFLLSYLPDLQDEAQIVATFVCRKLKDRPARFSGNIDDQGTNRRFGLLAQDNPAEPEIVRMMQLTRDALRRECNLDDLPEAIVSTRNEDQGNYALSLANMRTAGVTTIIAFERTTGPLYWGAAANAQGWYPEWVIPGRSSVNGVDESAQARAYSPTFWKNAFGISYDRLRGPTNQQEWYLAYKEGCSTCPDYDDDRNPRLYDSLTLLFWGIQAAGPRLTPENLDKGLHAIPRRPSREPTVPAAYFEPSNYSWIKDAIAIWWDRAGEDPDGEIGCYRVARRGKRFRAGEWPRGDGDLFTNGAICQGPA